MNKNTLISSIWNTDSIKVCLTRFSITHLQIMVDTQNENNQESIKRQKNAIREIKSAFEVAIHIQISETRLYDILQVAKDTVGVIDIIPQDHGIYVNTSEGKKTQGFGIVYGSYSRNDRIKNLVYIDDNHQIIPLPRMSYQLTASQLDLLKNIKSNPNRSIKEISKSLEAGTAITYRNIQSLTKQGLIENGNDGFILTLFGKLTLL